MDILFNHFTILLLRNVLFDADTYHDSEPIPSIFHDSAKKKAKYQQKNTANNW